MNRYSVINPMVKALLRSPFHRLMSSNTTLLEFSGHKSGKIYQMPVSYHDADDVVHIFTAESNAWWRNLQAGDEMKLRLRGHDCVGRPRVAAENAAEKRDALAAFLVASPRDAAHAGVAFDADGRPSKSDVTQASERLVHIEIELAEC